KSLVARALCATVLAVGLAGGAVGAQAQADPHSVATVSKVSRIIIHAYAYTTPRKVVPGARVKVVNLDDVFHTVTSDDGTSFAVGVPHSGGIAHFRAPMTPGRYAFHCNVHHGMAGVLVVK